MHGLENAVILSTWWALWTLADNYLIAYSPWSEIGVLALCATVVGAPHAWRAAIACGRGVARQRVKMVEVLDGM